LNDNDLKEDKVNVNNNHTHRGLLISLNSLRNDNLMFIINIDWTEKISTVVFDFQNFIFQLKKSTKTYNGCVHTGRICAALNDSKV
jgi:hypothetical protein